jgi:hypothetical protein
MTPPLSPPAKLLSMVFDGELRWRQHVQQAVKQAIKANIALSGLRYLCPGQIYQAFWPPSWTMHLWSGINPLEVESI